MTHAAKILVLSQCPFTTSTLPRLLISSLLAIAFAFASASIATVRAQDATGLRAGVTVERRSQPPAGGGTLHSKDAVIPDRHVGRGALIGAAVGASAGLVYSISLTQRPGVTDHSEDSLLIIFYTASGALIGLIVGGIAGYFWK
jgi:hypothetical protein